MTYLINKGLESELSFTIMENVRKGKGLKPGVGEGDDGPRSAGLVYLVLQKD